MPIGILLTNVVESFPDFIEKYYSNGIYSYIGRFLSRITGVIPISVAEIIIIFLIVFFLYKFVKVIRSLIKSNNRKRYVLIDSIRKLLIFISVGYFVFVIVWGLNYYRLPFADIAEINVKETTVEELSGLCENLILKANELRKNVIENKEGIMYIPDGYNDVFSRAHEGFIIIADTYEELGGEYGTPKGVFFSNFMSYTGITGMYFPYTGEANVNKDRTDILLPATVCHEMAHQRGFAREDEANYIAYLTCTSHPDADFKYSGTMLALIHSMNELYEYDKLEYYKLKSMYSDGILRDLLDNNNYWAKYSGPIDKASTKINNTFLKLNKQRDGVHSYGRMVDLLIAEYRQNNN
ncbi:membrane protein [Vallitalea longa]|uniref:Membrane protein n=1 Tax=Vallitalea longa TaxID=2936439 RepID=A0A9W6DI77_9FIRM|nr:membrane protein [Vallitalea longa]